MKMEIITYKIPQLFPLVVINYAFLSKNIYALKTLSKMYKC
jgi:hypothetical protein